MSRSMSRAIGGPEIDTNVIGGSKQDQRSWDRPVQLPAEDQALHLCARHRVMDLSMSTFSARPRDEPLPPDWDCGILQDAILRSEHCVFCRLIVDTAKYHALRENRDIIADPAEPLIFSQDAQVIACWIPDVVSTAPESRGTSETELVTLRLRIYFILSDGENVVSPFDIVPLAVNGRDGAFTGRLVDPNSIDLDLIRKWLQTCDGSHSEACKRGNLQGRQSDAITPFIRLLDLQDDCLIETSMPDTYIALSYVWGRMEVFKTLRANLSTLMTPGSLAGYSKLFPLTIQDAIILTRLLGYRYLWIDSICLVQDDDSDMVTQLRLMDIIYTKASFTIVSANGADADARLSGVVPGSRSLTQRVAEYSEDLSLVSLSLDFDAATRDSNWNGRGWTYQERILSRRLLVFTQDTVYFECGQATWSEDFDTTHPTVITSAARYTIEHSYDGNPPTLRPRLGQQLDTTLDSYLRAVIDYTSRQMTYATDRVRGFEGILQVFRAAHGSGNFKWGTWVERMMCHTILWQIRENSRKISHGPKTNMPLYPSWSWAGWTTAVKYDNPPDWNGLPELAEPFESVRPSEYCSCIQLNSNADEVQYPQDPAYYLYVLTRVRRFQLAESTRSSQWKPEAYPELRGSNLCQFGITRVHERTGVELNSDDWLGTITLTKNYRRRIRRKLPVDYDFIVLSEAYCFSNEELGERESINLGPYAAVNVMMIEMQGPSPTGKQIITRLGVGKMLKKAWEGREEDWREFLIA
ncbi:heterokaryon incompatibility protein-domain-containing protein [Xylariaceae sp. FL0255]|nr:heterokaryon incompatibility protein-domain-containing protein [Xylariaceae sp. FL0255]